ncbi:uncharacterized protein BKA55DRAFT_540537 [Fusarium redolens]|uniref:Uncharacterized protein n=1 Tax=Fusarium redolens TaxID=48865 RepID=A0A9P9H2I0_FUSRE|nr:uncharacterized protein BKA55DRAFT_540537 [Fusarium redolens]KAH7249128.1 hypothetical protein BKA55DRAFT_540537 [Fusarium redolens]
MEICPLGPFHVYEIDVFTEPFGLRFRKAPINFQKSDIHQLVKRHMGTLFSIRSGCADLAWVLRIVCLAASMRHADSAVGQSEKTGKPKCLQNQPRVEPGAALTRRRPTMISSGQPRTVSFSGGYASTYSTETIGHSQASTSPGNVRNGSTAASTENRIKEAQDTAYSGDRGRDHYQKGIVQNLW